MSSNGLVPIPPDLDSIGAIRLHIRPAPAGLKSQRSPKVGPNRLAARLGMQYLDNLRQNSGLHSDRAWRKFVARWSLVSLLLITVACYFSYGYYHSDEHYQIVEFVGHKLGKTPASELPWEFGARIRPWFQPAIYYAAAKVLVGLGIENPFTLATGFRAISGLCCWAAVTALMLAAGVLFPDDRRRRPAVVLLALLWLIPYLAVRTSGESLSGSFLTLGLAAILLGSAAVPCSAASGEIASAGAAGSLPANSDRRRFPVATMLVAGFCFGLAFEFRFQTAIATLGVMAWVLCFSGEGWRPTLGKLALMCSAGIVPLAVGTLLDRWGYGEWTCVPWNLFYVDLVRGVHNKFGVSPAWWYLTALAANPLAPITLLWVGAMLVTWFRHPRHILTWTTLPFCVVHSLIGHKELRFLFPLVLPATLAFVLAYAPRPGEVAQPGWLRAIWDRRGGWAAKLIYGLNLLLLAVKCLTCGSPDSELQRCIYDHYSHGCTLYMIGAVDKDPYLVGRMFFYRPSNLIICQVADYDALRTGCQPDRNSF